MVQSFESQESVEQILERSEVHFRPPCDGECVGLWGKGGGLFRYYLVLAATYVGSYLLKDEALNDSCCLRRMQDEAERRNADVWPAKRRLSP